MAQGVDRSIYITVCLAFCVMIENTSGAKIREQEKDKTTSPWPKAFSPSSLQDGRVLTNVPPTPHALMIGEQTTPPSLEIDEQPAPPSINAEEKTMPRLFKIRNEPPPHSIMEEEPLPPPPPLEEEPTLLPPFLEEKPTPQLLLLGEKLPPPPPLLEDQPPPPPPLLGEELPPPPPLMEGELHSPTSLMEDEPPPTPPLMEEEPPTLPLLMIEKQITTPSLMIEESPPPTLIVDPAYSSVLTSSTTRRQVESKANNQNITDDVKYDLDHLQKLCPLADICTTNRSDKHMMEMERSCCLPCKCNAMCKKMGNCCDKRDSRGFMCHTPIVEHMDETNKDLGNFMLDDKISSLGFFMVDKCLHGFTFIDCSEEKVAPWGTLYPVYDPVSDINFYNHRCAECNGAYNYVYWNLDLEALTYERSLTTCLNAISGRRPSDCKIGFTPPKEMNKMIHICSHDLISTCNVTGQWKQYDANLELACFNMFSPVLGRSGWPEYANVYCAQCNGVRPPPFDLCIDQTTAPVDPPLFVISQFSLSMIMEYDTVASAISSLSVPAVTRSVNGKCGQQMAKHPTKEECRTVLCPNGYFRDKEGCTLLSSQWQTSLYFIQLIMTPVETTDPMMLDVLIGNETAFLPPEMWFESHIKPLDYFRLYAETQEIEAGYIHVEQILVRVGRRLSPLDIATETKMLRDVMGKTWTINLKEHSFSYTVDFDKYAIFVADDNARRYDIVHSLSNNIIYEGLYPGRIYDLINQHGEGKTPDVVLKKTHFCDRVRLSRSEWEGGFQTIRMFLDSQESRELGDSEFDIFTDEDGRPTVEICVEDFNPSYKLQQGIEGEAVSTSGVPIENGLMFAVLVVGLLGL